MAAKFELLSSRDNQTYFNLKAANGEIILTSEMYTSKGGAANGITSVKTNAPNDARYDRRTSEAGEPYFVLKAANGEIIGRSEMYSSESGRDNGIQSVKDNAPNAEAVDLS